MSLNRVANSLQKLHIIYDEICDNVVVFCNVLKVSTWNLGAILGSQMLRIQIPSEMSLFWGFYQHDSLI